MSSTKPKSRCIVCGLPAVTGGLVGGLCSRGCTLPVEFFDDEDESCCPMCDALGIVVEPDGTIREV